MRFRSLLALLMTGCALIPPTDGPRFTPITPVPADKATVYIYSPVQRGGYWGDVFLNFEKRFPLGSGGYGLFALPAGEYQIYFENRTHSRGNVTRTLMVEAGREYYVRVSIGGPIVVHRIELAPREQALKEIAETHLHQSVSSAGSDASVDPKAVNEVKQRAENQQRIQEAVTRCEAMGYERAPRGDSRAYYECLGKMIRQMKDAPAQ